jgi:putative AlgH/UPF0301 family transcriptional regulator
MSLSKLCLFAVLVAALFFAALQTSGTRREGLAIRTPKLSWCCSASALDKALFHPIQSANATIPTNWPLDETGEPNSAALLPVQSKNPEDLNAGKLLVASRGLPDPNFAETVILIVHHDADGVVGLVLNRRTEVPLSRVLDQFADARDRKDPVYLGGPVETPQAFALLRSTAKFDGAEQVLSGVYWITSKAVFEKAFSARPDPDVFHVYLGYAGWSTDQLRQEVQRGSWFIFQADARAVFDSDPDTMWRQMIKKTELSLAQNVSAIRAD